MAHVYKKIKKHKGITYWLQQAKANSRHSEVIAEDKDMKELLVASIDNKAGEVVEYFSEVPENVKRTIVAYAKG